MFCKFCGNQIKEGTTFCPKCGQNLKAGSPTKQASDAAPAASAPEAASYEQTMPSSTVASAASEPYNPSTQYNAGAQYTPNAQQYIPGAQYTPGAQPMQPQAPSAINTSFNGLLNTIKILFSDAPRCAALSVRSNGSDWILTSLLFILAAAGGVCVTFNKTFVMLIKSLVGKVAPEIVSTSEIEAAMEKASINLGFWTCLAYSAVFFVVLAVSAWILTSAIYKKPVSFVNILNLTAAANIPLAVCYLVSMLLALIWPPLAIIATTICTYVSFAIIYEGLRSVAGDKTKSLAWGFAIIAVITVVASNATLMGIYGDQLSEVIASGGSLFGL